jgi:hypothetical protein
MSEYKFKIGDNVSFAPGRRSMIASSREYKIIRRLPVENGQPQYRIKGVSEAFERIALEAELSRRS